MNLYGRKKRNMNYSDDLQDDDESLYCDLFENKETDFLKNKEKVKNNEKKRENDGFFG